jgi:hypothetical protein
LSLNNKKIYTVEYVLKSAEEVDIVNNYGKICLVDLKIVCRRHATATKKVADFQKIFVIVYKKYRTNIF